MPKGWQRCSPFILTLSLACFCWHTLAAQDADDFDTRPIRGVGDVFLLSPGTGFARVLEHLLWTNNNGAVWNDITPPGPSSQSMYDVFFLDSVHGWVIFSDNSATWDYQIPVRMARTADVGRTWSPLSLDRSANADSMRVPMDPVGFQFIDPQHGWFMWKIRSNQANNFGILFSTADSGTTWTELPYPPSGREFSFYTPQDGWIVGSDQESLEATHDGGKTWQPTKPVATPADCSKCIGFYSVPSFQDRNDGILEVHYDDYSSLMGHHVYATYVTHDGANSWQNSETFEQDGPDLMNTVLSSLLSDHVVRAVTNHGKNLNQIYDRNKVINFSYPGNPPSWGSITDIQFVDDINGWIIYFSDTCTKLRRPDVGLNAGCLEHSRQIDLLTTADGGKTFRVITPPSSPATSK